MDCDDSRRDFVDLVARLAIAVQKAGGDHLGDVNSVHRDLIRILVMVPKELRTLRVHDMDVLNENLS